MHLTCWIIAPVFVFQLCKEKDGQMNLTMMVNILQWQRWKRGVEVLDTTSGRGHSSPDSMHGFMEQFTLQLSRELLSLGEGT